MNKPTVHYDPQSDVLYFLVRDGEEERFMEVAEGVNVELDQEGQHSSDQQSSHGQLWYTAPDRRTAGSISGLL